MLSADAVLNEATLLSILESGHSRIPVHKPGNRCARTRAGVSLLNMFLLQQTASCWHACAADARAPACYEEY